MDVDDNGNVYVTDAGNHAIRKITPSGFVSTIAGTGGTESIDGPGSRAQFNLPVDIACAKSGEIFVTDKNAHVIKKIDKAIPMTINAPKVGNRFNDENDVHYYYFTVASQNDKDFVFTVNAGNILTSQIYFKLYGPDNSYTLVTSATALSHSISQTLATGTYRIALHSTGNGRTDGAYTIRITNDENQYFGNGQIVDGTIDGPSDNDWYEFTVASTKNYTIETSNIGLVTENGTHLYLYAKHGSYIRPVSKESMPDFLVIESTEPNSGGVYSTMTLQLDKDITYWLRVRRDDPIVTDRFTYKIQLKDQ